MWYSASPARLGLLCLPVLLALPLSAQSVELDFSSIGDSLIEFNSSASTFDFTSDNGSGYTFQIGASSNDPALVGYKGFLTGTFTIGAVTTMGAGAFQVEEAPVTGTGALVISDGTSDHFAAQVAWTSVVTLGGTGALNPTDSINLSDFSYSGSNAALLQLAADKSGVANISFQFIPSQSVDQLASGSGIESTTFSGSLAAIPEPGTYALITGALALCGAFAWKRIQARTGGRLPPTLLADN